MTINLENLRVTEGHKNLSAFIKRETGKSVKPESIALVLALQAEYRKDPQHRAERQKIRDAARERRQAALEKHLAKARELADRLGYVQPDLDREPTVHEVEDASGPLLGGERVTTPAIEAAPAKVRSIASAPSVTVAKNSAMVDSDGFDDWDEPDVEIEPLPTNDFGADTSAIEVVESSDGWQPIAQAPDMEDDF